MIRLPVLAAAILASSAALAQPYYGYPPPPYPGYHGYPGDPVTDFFTPQPLPPGRPYRGLYANPYYRGRAFGAPAQFCQKLCLQDFAPCDPPEYKRADGRCTNPNPRL